MRLEIPIFRRLAVLAGAAALLAMGVPAGARPIASPPDARCEALARTDFSLVEDAPARVITATIMPGAGDLPGYCEIVGYAWRTVKFRVRLPTTGWNGKLVMFGTGGQAGDFQPDDPLSATSWSVTALRQGFATAAHDGGHLSSPTDAQWAYQNESALLDYGFRAPHVAGLGARAVVRAFYGRAARRVYFQGCSNGGREALQMAQRYPLDYDGIIAGAPSMLWSDLFPNLFWFANRMYGEHAVLDRRALQLLHRHVLDRCDRIDGRQDGILDDPRKCRIDLAPITCKAPGATGCLTPAQAKAAREIYDGPRDRSGRRVARSSALPGSELVWDDFAGIEAYAPSVFRYQSFMPAAGPGFVPEEAHLADYVRRSGGSDAILSATNPDLRRFRDNGGKLLSYMGWNDPIGGVHVTIDYHAMVERVMGGREATRLFYRLFMVPGMNHCSGGDGASQADWLAALDGWVDRGQAPDTISAHHPDDQGKAAFVRTLSPLISDNDQ